MQVAAAIADDVRRRVLELLAAQPMTAGAIAQEFPVSRPAVSRHLRVLRNAGLVHDELLGRERVYRLDVAPLRELVGWVSRLDTDAGWEQRLDALETEVARTRRGRSRETAAPTEETG